MAVLNQKTGGSFSLWAVVWGTFTGLVISLLGSVIIGAGYYFTALSESNMPWLAAGLLFISVLTGAWTAACRAGSMGLLHGLGVAVLLFLLSWLFTATVIPAPVVPVSMVQKLVLTLVAGALGGVLGVGSSG
ncbi:MAG: TIGR04086 family membrane protein [Thermoanaerobacteraceae bacterium]|nr:TIGR04086 family membrane protein [Thermoanaerobacteraceae bacterium]